MVKVIWFFQYQAAGIASAQFKDILSWQQQEGVTFID